MMVMMIDLETALIRKIGMQEWRTDHGIFIG